MCVQSFRGNLTVKEFGKSVSICQSYDQVKCAGFVQCRHGCFQHLIRRPSVTLTFNLQNPTRSSERAVRLLKQYMIYHANKI